MNSPSKMSQVELLAEIPSACKKILHDLEEFIDNHPDPKTIQSNRTSFICRSFCMLGILFELFSLYEPSSILRSVRDILKQEEI